jgi:hypothetical protein
MKNRGLHPWRFVVSCTADEFCLLESLGLPVISENDQILEAIHAGQAPGCDDGSLVSLANEWQRATRETARRSPKKTITASQVISREKVRTILTRRLQEADCRLRECIFHAASGEFDLHVTDTDGTALEWTHVVDPNEVRSLCSRLISPPRINLQNFITEYTHH